MTKRESLSKTPMTEEEKTAFSTVFQDKYKSVILHAEKPQNYYRLASTGDAIAEHRQNPDVDDKKAVYATEFDYGDSENKDGEATFTIDKPLDGAGVMVVNGNLRIEDTFAYHGILVVTGDLRIRPTEKTGEKAGFQWSPDGWPLDADGHKLFPANWDLSYEEYIKMVGEDEIEKKSWYYLPAGMRDITDKATLETPEMVEQRTYSVPELADPEWRGELILQGKLLVKGRIVTETVDGHTGRLNAYWSESAVDAMSRFFPLGKPAMQRVMWTHDDGIDVNSIWQDKQD
jgi:hypothetical protein